MNTNEKYTSPLSSRYSSDEMQLLFSPQFKFSTWRRLWIALAEAEQELGLDITDEQLDEMRAHIGDIDFETAAVYEKKLRHDVMAHVHTYGACCPKAMPIIHLGATSCYVVDNTDIIIMRDALKLVKARLIKVLRILVDFADRYKDQPTLAFTHFQPAQHRYKDQPTLAFTHFQPAQPTSVGKRATLWINELMLDLEEIEQVEKALLPLGSKGTTGTQASFLELFDGDYEKVRKIDLLIARKMGFEKAVPVSGQTYSRKVDSRVLDLLSHIAQSAHKFSNDIRLLAHLKEVEEPFEKDQIGSSAMAYKRNPMRSERIASLSRYVIVNAQNAAITAATQWFERTLDDSANKRISVAEGFLAVDAVLSLYANVANGLVVYPKVIEKRMMQELPFMATENIMMDAVKRGGDRQALHELIRQHSMAAGYAVKMEGKENDLLDRIAADEAFGVTREELEAVMQPKNYIGCAAMQTAAYLEDVVRPVLARYTEVEVAENEIKV